MFARALSEATTKEAVVAEFTLIIAGERRHYDAGCIAVDSRPILSIVRDITERTRGSPRTCHESLRGQREATATMNPWPATLVLSAFAGTLSGLLLRGTRAMIVGGAVPCPGGSGAVLSRDTRQVSRAQIVDCMHYCAYTVRSMADDGEWYPRKAAANLKKHGVDFADAATLLHDEQAITVRDDEGKEERYVTVGMDALGNVLVVVYTWRGDRPRFISARRATPQEREQYGVQP